MLVLVMMNSLMCLMNEVCVLDITFVHPQLTQDNLVIPYYIKPTLTLKNAITRFSLLNLRSYDRKDKENENKM